MSQTRMIDELLRAEGLLVEGNYEQADALLSELAEDAEEYVDRNCKTTDEVQYFSFPTLFERLAYRRVENDPRELREMNEPLDRLYSDLAIACVHEGDYARATEALKQAVRWNPMDCSHRLNLADLYRTNGDINEYLGLTYSCFERASEAAHLVRAYLNFAGFFESTDRPKLQAACLRCARRLDMSSSALDGALAMVAGTDADPDTITDEQARDLLEQEGLPEGANAEIAVSMLMVASDAAATGHKNLATTLTVRARDLIGASAAAALIELIHQSDSDSASSANGETHV
ncbi:tetratricopeptide repeat protein [Atopobium fossor]|uniref:hypothetical protein n=1 Tax=Atopobium fossor TaxID=39487 RepID=UPI00040E3F35|nr:hypothetical protein [Atopobium fossor]